MKEASEYLAEKLNIIGPINFQYAVKDDQIYCIEANPRGSRTLPFLSKSYNLSLPAIATDALIGDTISSWHRESAPYFCVKQSTFPFDRFSGESILLGPKMRSTGETMGIDRDKYKAVLKSYLGNYPDLIKTGKILMSFNDQTKEVIHPYLNALKQLGYEFYATTGTRQYIEKQSIACNLVRKIHEKQTTGPDMLEIINYKDLRMVLNTPTSTGISASDGKEIRDAAINRQIPCFTRVENIKALIESLIASRQSSLPELEPIALQELSL